MKPISAAVNAQPGNPDQMITLSQAIAIAAQAHAGQLDKGGAPYILHPLRVMLEMPDDDHRIVAVLHDVVEDTDWSFHGLHMQGCTREQIDALAALTRDGDETYSAFIGRVALNSIAICVKLADIEDNMNLFRLPLITQVDVDRQQRYREAKAILEAEFFRRFVT